MKMTSFMSKTRIIPTGNWNCMKMRQSSMKRKDNAWNTTLSGILNSLLSCIVVNNRLIGPVIATGQLQTTMHKSRRLTSEECRRHAASGPRLSGLQLVLAAVMEALTSLEV